MIVIPAIDLRGGRCVRLHQGDFDRETVYSDDPAAVASRWTREGAQWLHVVDLDGALIGQPAQLAIVEEIRSRVDVHLEVGGGIRTADDARAVLAFADRIVLGTVALESPNLLDALSREFRGRIYVALDARDGFVATRGWKETSRLRVAEAARRCEEKGAAGFLFTDIARDGTGRGVNAEATAALADRVSVPVIASGGVGSIADVRAVRAVETRGIAAVIIGRALYTGAVALRDAIAAAGEEQG